MLLQHPSMIWAFIPMSLTDLNVLLNASIHRVEALMVVLFAFFLCYCQQTILMNCTTLQSKSPKATPEVIYDIG